jgi:hypothetical protein
MMILNHVNCNDYSICIFHRIYLYIYPRVMGAKNVDCEFHKKITSIQLMILNNVKCNNDLICINMKISQKCLDQFLKFYTTYFELKEWL